MSDKNISPEIDDIEEFHDDAFADFVTAIMAGTEDKEDADDWRKTKEGKLAIATFIAGMEGEQLKADISDEELDDFISSLDAEEVAAINDIMNDVLTFDEGDVSEEEEELEEGHMTPKEIRLRKIYLRSARGKKALRKYLKKVNRQGYVKDKALSRKRKKEARRRIYHQGQHKTMENDKNIDGIQLSEMDAEFQAHFWNVLYEFALIKDIFAEGGDEELLEACVAEAKKAEGKVEDETIDPESGEEQIEEGEDEELCIEICCKDSEKVMEAAEANDCFVFPAEVKEEVEDSEEEPEEKEEKPVSEGDDEDDKDDSKEDDDKEDSEEEPEDGEDDDEEDDEKFILCGCRESLQKCLEALGIEGDVDDFKCELDEAKSSSADYQAWRKQARKPGFARKRAIYMKKYNAKRKHGYKPAPDASRRAMKAAKNRRKAIHDSLEEQFAASPMFGSLNESESVELKNLVFESVENILEKSCERIVADTNMAMQDYINEEFIPATCEIFESYKEGIVKELYTNVDGFLSNLAEEIVDELSEKNVFVKSEKTSVYEGFVENLIDLMEERLQIIPEREDALAAAKRKIEEMATAKEEQIVENSQLLDKLEEAKREAYIYKNMPTQLSESMKEKLVDYANTILVEEAEFGKFAEAFDKAISDTLSIINEDELGAKEDEVVETPAPVVESVASKYLSVFERLSK